MMKEMIAEIQAILGNDYTVGTRQVDKANGITRTGFIIRKSNDDSGISPTIYYENGMTAQYIVDRYMQNANYADAIGDVDVNEIATKEYILANVIPVLYNAETSANILVNTVHRTCADLVIVYRVVVSQNVGDVATYLVKTDMIDKVGITEDELYKTSMANIQGKGEACDIISALIGRNVPLAEGCKPELVVVTGANKTFGASYIFDKAIQQKLTEIYGEYYILPSSVHEVLITDKEGKTVEALTEMVKSVNTDVLNKADYLSDNIYVFTDTLEIVERG